MIKKSKIIFFSEDSFDVGERINKICNKNNWELEYAYSLTELVIKHNKLHAQYIIADYGMYIYKNDLVSLLTLTDSPRPILLFLSNDNIDLWHKETSFIYKIPLDNIANFIESNLENSFYFRESPRVQSLLNNYLKDMSFDPKYIGYNYLKQALLLCLEDKEAMKSLNSRVYPIIAERYNTSTQSVNRDIRNLIEQSSKKEDFNRHFEKTSNRAIISCILNEFEDIVNDYNNMGILS